jgi:hypothetical protein
VVIWFWQRLYVIIVLNKYLLYRRPAHSFLTTNLTISMTKFKVGLRPCNDKFTAKVINNDFDVSLFLLAAVPNTGVGSCRGLANSPISVFYKFNYSGPVYSPSSKFIWPVVVMIYSPIFFKSIVNVKIPSKTRLYHPKTFRFGTPLS